MSLEPKPSRAEHRSGYETSTRKEEEGMQGVHLAKGTMGMPVKVPCVECPLRRSAASGYLGGYTPEMYVEAMHSPASLACHMSPGFEDRDISRQKHCTGVAGYRANVGHIAQVNGMPTNAHLATRCIGETLDTERLFFSSPEEFIAHHKPGQKK